MKRHLPLGILALLALTGCMDDTDRPVLITAQPADASVVAGATASFSVGAEGDVQSYQWQRSTDEGQSWSSVGGDSPSYSTPPATAAMNGYLYRVRVADTRSTILSSSARLTVTTAAAAPVIVVPPASQTVTAPASASFSVTASGTSLLYQWQGSTDGTSWIDIAGAVSATYDTGATDVGMHGRQYRVVVSNSAGSVDSQAAMLTVTAAVLPVGGDLQPLTGPAEAFPHEPAAISATVEVGSRQRFGTIPWAPRDTGHILALTHSNGTQMQLALPAGVFRDEVFLTLTEIAGIGSAVTEVLAALRVEPADLLAEKPITAGFTIPEALLAGVDATQLVGFLADADGSNLHLVPIVAGPQGAAFTRPALSLPKLGIAGIALATPAQQAALAAAWPVDAADQLSAALAAPLMAQWRAAVQPAAAAGRMRALNVRPHAVGDDDPLAASLRGYYNNVVVPAFADAHADPAQIPAAIDKGHVFLRHAALTGLDQPGEPFHTTAADLDARIHALLDLYADHAAAQCRNPGGPAQFQTMLGAMRWLMLMGHDDKAAGLEAELLQCSRLKVQFKAEYEYQDKSWNSYRNRYVVEGDTQFSALDQYHASGALRLTAAETDRSDRSWEPDVDHVSHISVQGLEVPVVRTRRGARSTSLRLVLHSFGSQPLGPLLRLTETFSNGNTLTSNVTVPMIVPALPLIQAAGGGTGMYGPMLIPQSGSAFSSATRDYSGYTQTQQVTVTLTRAE